MGLLDSVLKVFVGDKTKKDIKEIQPLVDQILKIEPQLSDLSLDQLRHKTVEFKEKLAFAKAETTQQIESLKEQANLEEDIDKREEIYAQIDGLEDQAYEIGEATLLEILPEAFACARSNCK